MHDKKYVSLKVNEDHYSAHRFTRFGQKHLKLKSEEFVFEKTYNLFFLIDV